MCEPLMPDVVAPEAHQNDRSYLSELSGPTFDSIRTNFMVGGYMQEPKKPIKLSKLGSGCLRGDGLLPRTIRYVCIYSTNCIEQCMQAIQVWE